MLILFQILFVLFALFVMREILKRKSSGLLSLPGAIFWIVLWILALIAVLAPSTTQMLASYFGIGRGTDFVVYVSFAVMFFVLFRLHIKIESIQRDITKVVRKDTLDRVDSK